MNAARLMARSDEAPIHTGIVSCMVFMPDGKSLVSGSRDHTVKFWDMTQLEDMPDR